MRQVYFTVCIASLFLGFSSMGVNQGDVPMSSQVSSNLFNLNQIYNDHYQYSLPKKILEGFISGKAFDHPVVYTKEETENLHDDITDLFENILASNPAKEKEAHITVGAPGVGKTTLVRKELFERMEKGNTLAYICPDDICLKNQMRTYVADLASSEKTKKDMQNAYNKWRPGSNAATHLILANLIREKFSFYFGSTSSSPSTAKFFEFLKEQGYFIRLIHVNAKDEVRWASIQERDKVFVQTTKEDIVEKGLLVPQRINDTYLKYADQIDFYYRPDAKEDAILSATWLKEESSEYAGTMEVIDTKGYANIKAIHNKAIDSLKSDLFWEDVVESKSKLIGL